LRDARCEAGLTLRQLETESGGQFKTSAVGGYERGERDISAVRLVELADALQTRPDALIAAAMRRLQPDGYQSVSVNLRRLAKLPGPTPVLVGGLAQRLKLERGDPFTDVVTIRSGDLAIVASEARCSPEDVVAGIRTAIVTTPARRRPSA
jgi:transcriptional regulator with XRE-family HTH domain